MSDDQQVEQQIQAKGLTAPRVTPEHIDTVIVSEHYFTAEAGVYGEDVLRMTGMPDEFPESLSLLTFCVLVLRNGFTVTGESACASPENFDAEVGRQVARRNAREKVWSLEGYLLREQLHRGWFDPQVTVEA